MPGLLALFLCIIFILWLFVRDRELHPMTSPGLWVAFLWIAIIGSRPVSYWFNLPFQAETTSDYLTGSPMDRNVFFVLMILGMVVLLRRKVDWAAVFTSNRWFFLFFVYCGISIFWSDYPFVSLKRWIKDVGNVMMVLIILTDKDSIKATRALFSRYIYIAIPLSVVLIKYFPEYGRYYNQWTWTPLFSGITSNKNELGVVALTSGLFLLWDFFEMLASRVTKMRITDLFGRIALAVMLLWLLHKADSSTTLVCLIIGVSIILYLRYSRARLLIRHLGMYSLVLFFLFVVIYSLPDILAVFVNMVGRNITFTGRTALWADLWAEHTNPIIGTGYTSFWLGSAAQQLWEKYYFHPNQAHNGYLETYLNGGAIGVFLLLGIIISTGMKMKRYLSLKNNPGSIFFSFLVVSIFYNWTEAAFNRLSLIWIVFIISALYYQRSSVPEGDK